LESKQFISSLYFLLSANGCSFIFLAKKRKPSRERGDTERKREKEEVEKNGEVWKHVKQLL
jgi:hypothetical protein